MRAGKVAYQRGDYEEAVEQAKAALKEAEDFGEHDPRYATTLNIPRRGLYLGQRLPDDSRYGRYLIERPGNCRSTLLPPVVGTERAR